MITYLLVCSNPHDYENCYYNKLYTNSFIPKKYRIKANYYNQETIQQYQYQYILKPYICDSFSLGVQLIHHKQEHDDYFKFYHPSFTMVEEYTNYPNEVGVTYIYHNGKYHYVSCIKRNNHKDSIIDYGKEYMNDIWEGNPCGHNADYLLTSKLIHKLNKIGKSIPGNNIGRYDIKYKNDNKLKEGKKFIILEVNGGLGLDLDITTVNVYRLYERFTCFVKWLAIRMLIGWENRYKINHAQCFQMHFNYARLIIYHWILQQLNVYSKLGAPFVCDGKSYCCMKNCLNPFS